MTLLRLLPVLFLAACATRTAIESSREFARLGDTYNAFYVLDRERKAQTADGGEVSEELAAAHHAALLEFLRGRARDRIFQEQEDKALVDLGELETLAPGYPGAGELKAMAQRKKALQAVRRGDDKLLRREYAEAMAEYMEAQHVWPGLEATEDGITKVRDAMATLTVRAQQEFLEAVRKLPEFRFVEVQWHAANVLHNVPEREDAKEIRAKAKRENAQSAAARGRECENQQKFGAALVEYRMAQRTDPTLPGIEETIQRMEQEMQAAALVDKAQKDMRAHRFDAARKGLGEAFELSVLTRNEIGKLQIETRRLEGQQRYQGARDLEILGKKSEALAAFEALAKDWPEGMSDEKARIDALRTDVDGAAKEWAEAEAAEAAKDLPKAIEHYLAAEAFYPGWKDGKARIERLRASIAKQPPPPPEAQKTDEQKQPPEETPVEIRPVEVKPVEEKPPVGEKPPSEKPTGGNG